MVGLQSFMVRPGTSISGATGRTRPVPLHRRGRTLVGYDQWHPKTDTSATRRNDPEDLGRRAAEALLDQSATPLMGRNPII